MAKLFCFPWVSLSGSFLLGPHLNTGATWSALLAFANPGLPPLLGALCLCGTRGHCFGSRSRAYPERLGTLLTLPRLMPRPTPAQVGSSSGIFALGQIGKRRVLTVGLAEVPLSVLLSTCQVGHCMGWARGCHLGHPSHFSTGGLGHVTLIH